MLYLDVATSSIEVDHDHVLTSDGWHQTNRSTPETSLLGFL